MSGPNRRLRRSFQIPLARQGRDEIVVNLENLYEKLAILDNKIITIQLEINQIVAALKEKKILELRRVTPGGIEVPDGAKI